MRPLGIPNFYDRIVQEAIMIVLEAIYDPVFNKIDGNYRFRPGKGCYHCIHKLKKQGVDMNLAIEGDIKGAYDNVNQKKLLKILGKKIQDHRFLNLLKQGFKAGILETGHYEDTLLGVPQGGIASPILFNIYMHEFDTFIRKFVTTELRQKNLTERRNKKPGNPEYSKIHQRLTRLRKKYLDWKLSLQKLWINYSESEKAIALDYRTKLKELSFTRVNLPSLRMDKHEIKLLYTRYADDWIIFINSTLESANELKLKIATWLKENLDLELSEEKTYITNLRPSSAKFLGFSLKTYHKRRISKSEYGEYTKTAGWDLIVDMDLKRILERLYLRGFANRNFKPIAKAAWFTLREEQIMTKYNQILCGIGNYFPMIDRRSITKGYLYSLFLLFRSFCKEI